MCEKSKVEMAAGFPTLGPKVEYSHLGSLGNFLSGRMWLARWIFSFLSYTWGNWGLGSKLAAQGHIASKARARIEAETAVSKSRAPSPWGENVTYKDPLVKGRDLIKKKNRYFPAIWLLDSYWIMSLKVLEQCLAYGRFRVCAVLWPKSSNHLVCSM